MDAVEEYKKIVSDFRFLTGAVGPNGRCCEDTWDGAPRCCYQIADGAPLIFTDKEMSILDRMDVDFRTSWTDWPDGRRGPNLIGALSRTGMDRAAILRSTHTGSLANTLECASHPTRPVVISGRVVAVVVVKDCNTRVALESYRDDMLTLRALWQRAVNLLGMKPYYVTSRLDDGLILL